MPSDLGWWDVVAVVWMLACWVAYGLVVDRAVLMGRPSLNVYMAELRVIWVREMLKRDVRIMDSQLVGHTINSVTFFASATTIVIAGVVGLLGSLGEAQPFAERLLFIPATSIELFELKVLALLAIFIAGFFSFTWSLRQYNYCCALIGAAPPEPLDAEVREAAARPIARVMTLAIGSFNNGLRAYYFAVATLAWFVDPLLFIAASTAVLLLLARRQLWSGARTAVGAHLALCRSLPQA